MENCDCWIGILNDYYQTDRNFLYKSDYKKKCSDLKFPPSHYLDRRKNMSVLFDHCPWCGSKFDWTKLKKQLN